MAASFALMFIPGVGQALYAAFQFLFQAVFAVVKFLLGAALQFLGAVFSGIGSVLGSFASGIGQFFSGIGGHLASFGRSLVGQAKSFFQTGIKDLFNQIKLGSFSLKKALDSTFQSLKNQLNPVTYYKNLYGRVTESLHQLGVKGSLNKLLEWSTNQFLVNLAQNQIDKSLEKSKMNSFLKAVLSTVSSASLQAIGSAFTEGFFHPQTVSLETSGARAPPTGIAGFFERVRSGVASATGLVTQALKNTVGFIKSLFIWESPSQSDSLSPGFEALYQEYLARVELDDKENPYRVKLGGSRADINYDLKQVSEGIYYTPLDAGVLQELRLDPRTKQVRSTQRIGNLEDRARKLEFFERLREQEPQYPDDFPNLGGLGAPAWLPIPGLGPGPFGGGGGVIPTPQGPVIAPHAYGGPAALPAGVLWRGQAQARGKVSQTDPDSGGPDGPFGFLGKLGERLRAGFRKFTAGNFRENLARLTGQNPTNAQAHHVFPQKFRDPFNNKGINIDEPRYGAWWESKAHLKNSAKYNEEWRQFLRVNPTREQILEFGRRRAKDYGFKINF